MKKLTISKAMPLIKIIEQQNKLKVKRAKDFRKAREILFNSMLYN